MVSLEEFQNLELKVGLVLGAERVAGSEKLVRLVVDLGPSTSSGQAPSTGSRQGRGSPRAAGQVPSTGSASSPQAGSGRASDTRQIVAGIGKTYEPEGLVGKEIVVVANLEPRTFTLRQAQGKSLRQVPARGEARQGRQDKSLRHGSGRVVLESQGMLLAASDGAGPVLLVPERPVEPGERVR